ncbi:MAG: TatD family hydrolase [Clostridiales bacterium]|nr:TatD family hydrolase [Clostridiales bacterium]
MSHKHREPHYPQGYKGVFDTHAHLYDARIFQDAEAVLERALECGVDTVLVPADNEETSRLAVDYVQKWDGFKGIDLYCSVGVHPHEASSYTDDTERFLADMLSERDKHKIKALGEIGLDYYYDHSPRDVQRDVFRKQLKLSYELDIPFILHERDATQDCIDILKEAQKNGMLLPAPGVCHCCSCSAEIAKMLLDMGFYIGFDGPLTFKNNKKTPGVLEICPWDRIVAETDSPYLAPEPNRGMTNEPAFVTLVVEKIAQLKGVEPAEAARITAENGRRLFRL